MRGIEGENPLSCTRNASRSHPIKVHAQISAKYWMLQQKISG